MQFADNAMHHLAVVVRELFRREAVIEILELAECGVAEEDGDMRQDL